MGFKLKDKVRWVMGASKGHNGRLRTGIVVEVLQPCERPSADLFPELYKKKGCGQGRPTESYVVQVVGRLGKVLHYWPYAKRLEKV